MKIKYMIACAFTLLLAGCKPARQSSGQFPGATNNLQATSQRVAVSEWDKVKISDSGEIFVNKKQMSLTEFAAECQRLKQAGGAAMLYIDAPNRPLNPAQTEAFHKLVDAGVPMKAVQKESDLD